ncbi:hypothetical protein DFH09DRAFT_1076991 [Mycena vulgaris]|nr:hypothetical protein DFH09DRAFT_1076991 [Mycena vulgaris]
MAPVCFFYNCSPLTSSDSLTFLIFKFLVTTVSPASVNIGREWIWNELDRWVLLYYENPPERSPEASGPWRRGASILSSNPYRVKWSPRALPASPGVSLHLPTPPAMFDGGMDKTTAAQEATGVNIGSLQN